MIRIEYRTKDEKRRKVEEGYENITQGRLEVSKKFRFRAVASWQKPSAAFGVSAWGVSRAAD